MSTPLNTQLIHDILQKTFEPTELQVIDEGGQHIGHAHQGHFRVKIRSACFNGKNTVQIHRMIYNALQAYLEQGIHALAIDAKPTEV